MNVFLPCVLQAWKGRAKSGFSVLGLQNLPINMPNSHLFGLNPANNFPSFFFFLFFL